jgi:predicted outer membrane repeat protein
VAGDVPQGTALSRGAPAPHPRLGDHFAFHEPRVHRGRHIRRVGVTVAILTALAIGSGRQALATTFVVNDTRDLVDAGVGNGECRTSAGTCTLRAAIQEANALPGADAIQVPAGTYEIIIPPRNENNITMGDLDVTDSLTITGAGAGSTIIDGGLPPAGAPPDRPGLDRLFEVLVDAGAVGLSGLTLRDGYAAEYGGALLNNSTATVTITASTVTGNVAGKTGGGIDNHVGGTVHIHDSSLSDNVAFESGSALNNNRDGTVTVTNSTVADNSAAVVGLDEALVGAGAIANNAELDLLGTITVTSSQISDNRSGGGRHGAGISNDGGGVVTVDQSTFSKNRAAGNGGAIFNGTGQVTITDSTFSENAAKGGGAIANGGSLTVLDGVFSKNTAEDWGGGVLNFNLGGASIRSSSFTENSALSGGGFANEGSGLVSVESSTFTENAAVITLVADSGDGGGMHSNSGGQVLIAGVTFTENRARGGGGFSNEGGGRVEITGARFSENTAEERGGGILVQGGDVRMFDIDVVGNISKSKEEGGGGVSYAGDKSVAVGESAAIENSRIAGNRSDGQGGGIDSRGDGPLTISTTAITGNTAAVGGGIHHVGDAPVQVSRSTVSGNVAEGGGGVFADSDGEATVENTTISGNRASQFGGGLLVSSRLTIRNSTVADNNAPSGGGINNGGGDLVGDGTAFVLNTIVANNPTGGNCAGTITSLGGNVEDADSCQLREPTDLPGTDPLLGSLADNGGPTQTHALLVGSPAQERAVCSEVDPCPAVDQRGVGRPRFAGVDVGAYESELSPGGGGPQQCPGRTERPVLSDYDSWISQNAAGSNFGTDATLSVESQSGGNERALVHFDLPPVPPGCRLVDATLRMYASSATNGRTLEALRLASDWSELGVTWNNQPATAGPGASTQSGLDFREWNVLAQTLDMYELGGHGFLIRDGAENGTGTQSFHSREKGTDRPPELVLVFDDPDAPPRPGVCPTGQHSLSADRDSWVSQGGPSNNFGTDSTLKVRTNSGYNSRALLRFPLPRLPNGCTTIASAVLRLEASSAKDGRTLEALQIASSWTEGGVTWNNQPAVTGPAAGTPSGEGQLQWDVTEQTLGLYVSGNHGFLIRDAAENGVGDEQSINSREKATDGPPELVLSFDDSTPETSIDSGPLSPTEEAEATFTFSSDRADATFECSLDGAAFQACSSPHTVGGLTEGDHIIEVRSTRRVRAVDPTPAGYAWTVAIPPETTVAGPASPSASPNATVTFSSDDPRATFECSLDRGPFAACTSPAEYTDLADGEHQVRVQAVDPFGNVDPSPASHLWAVAAPPETTMTDPPPDPSNSTSASLEFTGSDNTTAPAALLFECRLDSQEPSAWASCSSPHSLQGLAEGSHTFEVRATDRAGNTDPTPATHSWTVDVTPPETTIDSGPNGRTASTSATFTFSATETGSTFECSLDTAPFAACASPRQYTGLAQGSHQFRVRAVDRAGNVDSSPASRSWTVCASSACPSQTTAPAARGSMDRPE